MVHDKANALDNNDASIVRSSVHIEKAEAHGRFVVECYGADGKLKWADVIENVVTIVGKNLALDTYLSGSAYTVVGPFMGLISSTSFTAVSATDTMSSHGGWLEAGNANAPTYTAPRKTAVFSSASAGSKSLSAALSFPITSTGTVKGCFLTYGTGAVSTIDDTNGTLYSAGLFSGGDKSVINSDILNITYTASL